MCVPCLGEEMFTPCVGPNVRQKNEAVRLHNRFDAFQSDDDDGQEWPEVEDAKNIPKKMKMEKWKSPAKQKATKVRECK